jgi:hypothetical protein
VGLVLDVAMDWLVMCSGWIFVRLSTGHSLTHSLTRSWRSKILPECPAETSGHLHMQHIACYWSFCRYPKSCMWNDILHTCNGTLLVTEAFADTQNLVCEVIFHIPVVTTLVILASKLVHCFWSWKFHSFVKNDIPQKPIITDSIYLFWQQKLLFSVLLTPSIWGLSFKATLRLGPSLTL